MRRWTRAEDSILEEFCGRGAAFCVRQLWLKCHSRRTKSAVVNRASRLGLSLTPVEVCPQCGRKVARLKQATGLCPLCHERSFVGANSKRSSTMRELAANEADPAYNEAVAATRRQRWRERSERHRKGVKEL